MSKWFKAKFFSKCDNCREEIYEGDTILYDSDDNIYLCKQCGEELEAK